MTFDEIVTGVRYLAGQIEMTRDEVIRFAKDWDPQPFHLSDEGAKANPLFGRLSASGWHTILLMQAKIDHFIKGTGLIGLAGGGVDGITWARPVFPPERLTVIIEFLEARASRSRPELGILKIRCDAYGLDEELAASMKITAMLDRTATRAV